jgi:hypothetical protein
MPSPPLSPPLAARNTAAKPTSSRSGRARRGGAAHTITGECERLFCETLRAVFLGEGNLARQDSLVTGVYNNMPSGRVDDYGVDVRRYTERSNALPSPETDDGMGEGEKNGLVGDWVEIWDYVGGNRFRGFVAEKDGEKSMFVFFDQLLIGADLKAGYVPSLPATKKCHGLTVTSLMALLELCDVPYFSCSRLVACLDRHADAQATEALTKDLGWIGFQLATLNDYTDGDDITSNKWLLMEMDV